MYLHLNLSKPSQSRDFVMSCVCLSGFQHPTCFILNNMSLSQHHWVLPLQTKHFSIFIFPKKFNFQTSSKHMQSYIYACNVCILDVFQLTNSQPGQADYSHSDDVIGQKLAENQQLIGQSANHRPIVGWLTVSHWIIAGRFPALVYICIYTCMHA